MSNLQNAQNERNATRTHIDDLAPQQELSLNALSRVVGGHSERIRGGDIKVVGGHGDSCDHSKFECD